MRSIAAQDIEAHALGGSLPIARRWDRNRSTASMLGVLVRRGIEGDPGELKHDSANLAPALAKLLRWHPLTEEEREAFLALPVRLEEARAGRYLVREGQKTDRCCALLSGYAFRQKITTAGARQILAIHLKGDFVDLQNGLLEQADHSVQMLTDGEVAVVPRSAMLDLVTAHPGIGRACWIETLVNASLMREWMLSIGRRDARQRIAHLLCELAVRQEVAGLCVGPNYSWPMTQEQLGDCTGLTSVHVNRTLQSLRADGLIARTRTGLTILDWEGLQSAGDFDRLYLHESMVRTDD